LEKVNSQRRICEIVNQLAVNHIKGLSNKELAELVGTSGVNICRDISVLQDYNWIIRGNHGAWRLSPEFSKVAASIAKTYREAYLQLKEDEALYIE